MCPVGGPAMVRERASVGTAGGTVGTRWRWGWLRCGVPAGIGVVSPVRRLGHRTPPFSRGPEVAEPRLHAPTATASMVLIRAMR